MVSIHIEKNPHLALDILCDELAALIRKKESTPNPKFFLALSGGETAKMMFHILKTKDVNWKNVHFFWVDERCVLPSLPASNFGNADTLFFKHIDVSNKQIHRLKGEFCPVEEVERYQKLVKDLLPLNSDGIPVFDCIILGIGKDAHTASIFPASMNLLCSPNLYEVVSPHEFGIWRMTMTGKIILAAKKILASAFGEEKKDMLKKLIDDIQNNQNASPAAYILSRANDADFFCCF